MLAQYRDTTLSLIILHLRRGASIDGVSQLHVGYTVDQLDHGLSKQFCPLRQAGQLTLGTGLRLISLSVLHALQRQLNRRPTARIWPVL